ncbi:MAG TPA: A/G-specific adenine glycosylase [Acidimicrobiales bacterium]|nr:A/G-specific adenine glycosylase [Acidimicrobiales bacterium]
MAPPLTPFQSAVLAWAPSGWRELPWRRTRDPWAVLVSELMLQQTQAARVVPKWEAFMSRWPTPAACAAAPVAEVVRAWGGLGYNRRALNLHRCAQVVTSAFAGELPSDLTALQALPGIGPYTGRAVLAFAFGADVGVVDTNAARVLARAVGGPRPAQETADALVPRGQGWAWNQAVLDLGATVCTARAPRCGVCPVAGLCTWRRRGGDDPFVRRPRPPAFAGSDRQARGRLLDALRAGPVRDVPVGCGLSGDPERAARIADGLVSDGFARWDGPALTLT